MEFFIRDKWVHAGTGDKLEVPKGVKHGFRNPGNSVVKVFNSHQPALAMEYYFEDVVKVLARLTDNGKKPFKMDLRAKMYLSVLMGNYRRDIIARDPPDLALRVLGLFGKLAGIKY
jgi:hypothetical protein